MGYLPEAIASLIRLTASILTGGLSASWATFCAATALPISTVSLDTAVAAAALPVAACCRYHGHGFSEARPDWLLFFIDLTIDSYSSNYLTTGRLFILALTETFFSHDAGCCESCHCGCFSPLSKPCPSCLALSFNQNPANSNRNQHCFSDQPDRYTSAGGQRPAFRH